jgi:hypothetical protein
MYRACVSNLQPTLQTFSHSDMCQPWEECASRCSRIEGSITTLASQVFSAQSANASSLADMHRVMLQIRSQLATLELNRPNATGPLFPPVSPGALIPPLLKLCVFCGASTRRITATSSLRHMFSCVLCPQSTCRYVSITEHMLNFKNAPLIGSPERCCWCGHTWADCKGNSLSPDARSKHKKLCHQAVLDRLKCNDPDVVRGTRALLNTLWSIPEVVENVNNPKRPRGDLSGRAPAAFLISEPECRANPAFCQNDDALSSDFATFPSSDSDA